MAVNKVEYGDETLIDLTEDTVTPETLLQGETAHDKTGAQITGTATGGSTIHAETYTPSPNISDNDMGENHKYRYVDTSGMVVLNNQEKTFTVDASSTSSHTVLPDNGYTGLSKVTINKPSTIGYLGGRLYSKFFSSSIREFRNQMYNSRVISNGVIECRANTYTNNLNPNIERLGGPYPFEDFINGSADLNSEFVTMVTPFRQVQEHGSSLEVSLGVAFTAAKTMSFYLYYIPHGSLEPVKIQSITTTMTLANDSDDNEIYICALYFNESSMMIIYRFRTSAINMSPLYVRMVTKLPSGLPCISNQLTIGAVTAGATTPNGTETYLEEYIIPLNPTKAFDSFGFYRIIEKITYNANGDKTARTETHTYNSFSLNTNSGQLAVRSNTATTTVNAVSTFNDNRMINVFIGKYFGVTYELYDSSGTFVSGGTLTHPYGPIAGAENNLAVTAAGNKIASFYYDNSDKKITHRIINSHILSNGHLLLIVVSISRQNFSGLYLRIDRTSRHFIPLNYDNYRENINFSAKSIATALLPGDYLIVFINNESTVFVYALHSNIQYTNCVMQYYYLGTLYVRVSYWMDTIINFLNNGNYHAIVDEGIGYFI